jgi:hypothetical protein
MVVLLKLFRHIVGNLTDSVKRSISDLWIGMRTVLAQNWHHHGNFLRIVNVLANLTKRHNTSMFVPPV